VSLKTLLMRWPMVIRKNSATLIDFEGLSIRDYTAQEDVSSSLAVISVPDRAVHPRSWSRRSDKFYYVISGTIEFQQADKTHVLSAGDFCLVPQGETFSYRNSSGVPAEMCLVHTPSFDLESEVFE
jgi:mannose-6-phosphate isomerase-like protein (cupin superfamily)